VTPSAAPLPRTRAAVGHRCGICAPERRVVAPPMSASVCLRRHAATPPPSSPRAIIFMKSANMPTSRLPPFVIADKTLSLGCRLPHHCSARHGRHQPGLVTPLLLEDPPTSPRLGVTAATSFPTRRRCAMPRNAASRPTPASSPYGDMLFHACHRRHADAGAVPDDMRKEQFIAASCHTTPRLSPVLPKRRRHFAGDASFHCFSPHAHTALRAPGSA